jgi:hypothetical protein
VEEHDEVMEPGSIPDPHVLVFCCGVEVESL